MSTEELKSCRIASHKLFLVEVELLKTNLECIAVQYHVVCLKYLSCVCFQSIVLCNPSFSISLYCIERFYIHFLKLLISRSVDGKLSWLLSKINILNCATYRLFNSLYTTLAMLCLFPCPKMICQFFNSDVAIKIFIEVVAITV